MVEIEKVTSSILPTQRTSYHQGFKRFKYNLENMDWFKSQNRKILFQIKVLHFLKNT